MAKCYLFVKQTQQYCKDTHDELTVFPFVRNHLQYPELEYAVRVRKRIYL